MNKTKKQLYEENKKLKNDRKILNDWLYDDNDKLTADKLVDISKKMEKLIKIIILISILLLLSGFYILGMMCK